MSQSTSSSDIYTIGRKHHSLMKPQISIVEPVSALSEIAQKCYCRYLWNYELHGLTQFLTCTTKTSKIFWTCFIGLCVATAAVFTDLVFREYLDRQKVTHITIRHEKELLYPTIVVCPKNADALNYDLVKKDLNSRISGLDNKTADQLIGFTIAGSGFDNLNPVVDGLNNQSIARLASLLHKWKGSRSFEEFFTSLYEKWGYTCKDLFNSCYYGSESLDCCKVFTPVYVMLRGRCWQLKGFYQRDPDEVGKVSLYMNQLSSPLADPTSVQSQVVIYISDRFPDIATFPRFYLNYRQWNRMRFNMKAIQMLPTQGQCSEDPKNLGRASCFVNNWIQRKVIERFGCTVFYFQNKTKDVPVCDPELIVKNYNEFVDPSMKKIDCLPPCLRFDTTIDLYSAEEIKTGLFPDNGTMPAFRLESSYTMLTYESYKEILTTSLQGFISQIGGQFGLFLGLSVITIVQFCFSMTKIGIKKAKKTYDDVDPFFKHLLENFEKENSNKFSNGDAIKEKPKELNLSDISV